MIGLGSGVVIGTTAFVITFFLTFSICSDTSTAEKVFPFAVIANPQLDSLIALALALIQFPLYGIVLGLAWSKTDAAKLMVITIVALLTIHLMAGRYATRRVETMWQQRFSHAGY